LKSGLFDASKFLTAWYMLAGLWSGTECMQLIFENKSNAYMDEHGVFQLAFFENSKVDLHDLEDPIPFVTGYVEEN